MNTAFLSAPAMPWKFRILFGVIAVLYGVLVWWAYRSLVEQYQNQTSSDNSSSSGHEVIPVEVENSP